MKKKLLLIVLVFSFVLLSTGFEKKESFDLQSLYDYQKEYKTSEVAVCSVNRTKTYMDYRAITNTASLQYKYIANHMTVDENTGFLYDEDGFIGVALGKYFGPIGTRYYFTLETGVVLPLVKIEAKAIGDTDPGNCYNPADGSVIEFVIDRHYAMDYFGNSSNGLVLNGNYNNYSLFQGRIAKIELVLDEKNEDYVTYKTLDKLELPEDVFRYASGY
ncbi:MAG: hypothetical protein PUD22_04815 [Erysipelotrichaceae bacterium]|nr:hypothetical protein [Erysipelotrichaceae bacterium]